MEQQNQQSTQKEIESKAPIKTNTSASSVQGWKFLAIVAVLGLMIGGTIFYFLLYSKPRLFLEVKKVGVDNTSMVQRYEVDHSGLLIAEGEDADFKKQLTQEQIQTLIAAIRSTQIMKRGCRAESDPLALPMGWHMEYKLYFEGETKRPSTISRGV